MFAFFIFIRTKSIICQHPATRVFRRVILMYEDGDDDLMHPAPALSHFSPPLCTFAASLCQISFRSYFYPSYGFLVVVSRFRLLYLPKILSYKLRTSLSLSLALREMRGKEMYEQLR
jgi:hypothetical protein